MNKVVLFGVGLLGTALVSCSSSSASISAEETLAVHFGVRGEMHQELDALEGRFLVRSQYWPRPNAAARISLGSMEGSWDAQNLCMTTYYSGELLETPLELTTATTWDDIRSCYVGVWMRQDGTSMLPLGDGHMDDSGSIVTVRCDGEVTVREVLQVISEDEHVREVHRTSEDGVEYLSLRLHMVRDQQQ